MLPKNNLDRVKEFKESLNPWINEQGIDEGQKKNRRQASIKIIDVYKNKKTELNLSNNQLTSLPEAIGNLTSLKKLYLSNNQLTSLPERIGNLKSLQILDLFYNKLTSLPETIGNLNSLKNLHLPCNQLTSLPEAIGNLKSLRFLSLSYNQITSLPKTIGNLNSLQGLDLSCNRLTSLPERIGNLTSLQELDLSCNQLTPLPETIGDLKSLRELYLPYNQLTSLPLTIGNLNSLQELNLSNNNQLSNTPETINILKNLERVNNHNVGFRLIWPEHLDRKNNSDRVKEFKESLNNWINEQGIDEEQKKNRRQASTKIIDVYKNSKTELDLSDNQLTSLPETIGNLTSLQILNLPYNQLTSLPEAIGDLTSLQILNLPYNQLTSLPERIGDLPSLQELYLSDNQLTSLPKTIGNLTSLKKLYLSENQLTSLPETIGNLNSLQELNLYKNQLTSLPETIGNLTSLQRLFLINNDQLSNTPETVSILENLELVNNHNDGFILGWPEHLDRNILVTKIKSLICDAYKEYYSSKPEIAEKIGINEPIDEETTPFLRLAHRFMKESLDERGSMKKIVDMMLPVAESIKKDPSLLEHIDASASIHTDACINQPVAGLTEIANIIDVVKAETIPEKLEKVKVIMAINVIRQEVGKFNRKGVEAELANAMLREVHNKLLSEGEIKEKWSGIPDGIAYERLVKNLLVDEVVNKIKEKVILELNKPLEVVADNVCEGTLGDFWSKIILDKEYLSKINESEDVLTIKSQIEKLDNNDEEYQKKIEELSKELKKAELSCKEKILTKSREETFKAIEANPPSKSPTPSGKEHPQGSESRKM